MKPSGGFKYKPGGGLKPGSKGLKPKRAKPRPGNRAQTKAEAQHITAVKAAPCVCCEQVDGFKRWGVGPWPLNEAHHLLSGGIRKGHGDTVPLCPWHHRGRKVVEHWDLIEHRIRMGPSLAEGSKPFHDRFGKDEELSELYLGTANA